MRKQIRLGTFIFLIFMTVFLGGTAYLTYYSNVVFEQNLPVVGSVMPEAQAEPINGKTLYKVPENAILRDSRNQPYLLVVRFENDILGERYYTAAVHVWLKGQTGDGMILVEGIVREEPVVVAPEPGLTAGMEVLAK